MYRMTRTAPMTFALLLSACSQPPSPPPLDGDWILDADASRISFVTVKGGDITEAHDFGKMSGTVSGEGAATVSIDLASVETNIDIRNERMREFLFETATYPEATVSAQLDPAAFSQLKIGEQIVQPVSAKLKLHGAESDLETELAVTRIGPDKVQVETTAPIIVDADTFALGAGLEKLKELAKLPSITPQVPVTFSIVFTHQD